MRRDRAIERAVGILQSNQIVSAPDALVEQTTLVLREILIVTRVQQIVALEQVQDGERDLLRIEVGGKREVRQMLAVIPCCVVPAAVGVNGSLLLSVLESKMRIRLGHLPRVALLLKVVDDIRQGVLFQQLLLDREGIGADRPLVALTLKVVLTFCCD